MSEKPDGLTEEQRRAIREEFERCGVLWEDVQRAMRSLTDAVRVQAEKIQAATEHRDAHMEPGRPTGRAAQDSPYDIGRRR